MHLRSVLTLTLAFVATLAAACTSDSDAVDVPVGDRVATSAPFAPSTSTTVATTLPSTTAASTTAPAAVTTATLATTTTGAPAPVTTAERTLVLWRQGDEDPRIAVFQAKLIALDYLAGGSDTGVFDGATNSAVLRFQGEYGLVVDGIVGPQTERAIGAAAQSVAPGG